MKEWKHMPGCEVLLLIGEKVKIAYLFSPNRGIRGFLHPDLEQGQAICDDLNELEKLRAAARAADVK